MAELMGQDGTWTFDGDIVRVVPGHGRGVHRLRKELGEIAVPLPALAGIAYEPGRKGKGGRIRLRLREGADPLTQIAAGRLNEAADPYRMAVDPDRTGVAEYLVDEVRAALSLEQVPDGPTDRYLLPGPNAPLTASGEDGTALFDGERIILDWNWITEESKRAGGPRQVTLRELVRVEWLPAVGWESGYLRFRHHGDSANVPPKYDPYCLKLGWGTQKEYTTTALLAAAVTARLPHPFGTGASSPEPQREALTAAPQEEAASGEDHDVLLRRLRELAELHREGVLTEAEFAAAKQALLRRF
ncbi:DUF4429 domain-containing protein [Marinactinospora thermotolerans]|uniref:Short C-terminal domain-containing protein n=1 Tax=Marinactinospora thermotolerans DSM 45154 TaxID=1122192 RepID=A0A1T4LYL1_9ACTN|nr:DUF4429 domain-containing protein [Marinactinospora thermotolerans]SJZ59554.1 Short C-terminal domain-containing protein [Marinactinospora thermotolerans DSM 45154]